MRKSKHFFRFSVLAFMACFLWGNQDGVLPKISELENLLDTSIPQWKILIGEGEGIFSPEFDDSSWEERGKSFMVRDRIFCMRQEWTVPEVFSGAETRESAVHLVFRFRGVGKTEGVFYLNGKFLRPFTLEFGNQTTELEETFLVAEKANPGERLCLALRLENHGKLPVVPRDTAEPGAFVQLQSADIAVESAREARSELLKLYLDLKAGAILLDFAKTPELPPHKKRPESRIFLQNASSEEFLQLKRTFREALEEINFHAIKTGDFGKARASIREFYLKAKPVSLFAQKHRLFLGGNSHIDLAWLWRWKETVEVSKETFSTILNNMLEYPEIVYIQSQAQVYKWMEDYYPEVFQRIREKVKEGRWEIIGGMWAEPDCNLVDGESFIRQILYGKRYFKEKFGVDVNIGWNPDSFGYNWNMPQFFRKSGFHTFVTQKISWNDRTAFPYFLFWWEAPDGSRILTYFPPTGYVGRLEAENMLQGMKAFEKNTGLKDVFILYGLGDHGGGPNREMLDRSKSYIKQAIFPKMVHSSFQDYVGLLREQSLEGLPVWRDELYLEYHRGTYTTQAKTKKWNRKSEVLLSNTEKVASLAHMLGKPFPQNAMKEVWERILMNQFHDILPGSSIHPVYRDAEEHYREAWRKAQKELWRSLDFLARNIDTSGGASGSPLVVFNPLSWERTGAVKVLLPESLGKKELVVRSAEGREVSSQVIPGNKGSLLCFIARDVPALGYAVYKVGEGRGFHQENSLHVEGNRLENRFFRVILDPESGNVISLFDKRAEREVMAPASQGNQLQLFEDKPDRWDAWNIQYTGRSWMLDKADRIVVGKKGPVMISLKVEKSFLGLTKSRYEPTGDFPSSFFTQEIILYEDIPRVDIEMNVDWWEDHVLLKVAFPVEAKSDWATYEIPYAFVKRPTLRNTEWEKARFEVPAIRWADLSGEEYGLSLLNESKYGHDVEGNVMRLTLLRSPEWPDPLADRGKHELAYALYPHRGGWQEAGTVQRGYEFNVPLLAQFHEEHQGNLPSRFSFFKASPPNVILSSVKRAEDRESLVLRLYEAEGKATEAEVEFFVSPKNIYELDLMEQRVRNLAGSQEKKLAVHFDKSEIKTIELEF